MNDTGTNGEGEAPTPQLHRKADRLLLKWGTIKGWDLKSEAALAAGRRYLDAGEQSMSAMAQHDSPEQQQALCDLIDAIDGEIVNDWSGERLTADEAKRYVLDYRA